MRLLSHHFHNEDQMYGAITVARSALSTILPKSEGKTFEKKPGVSRVLKRIYKLRLSLGKYLVTYDLDAVLKFIRGLSANKELML